jgi:hypothetical protein
VTMCVDFACYKGVPRRVMSVNMYAQLRVGQTVRNTAAGGSYTNLCMARVLHEASRLG